MLGCPNTLSAFADIAQQRCPAVDLIQISLCEALHGVDADAVGAQLDDDARALFGLAAFDGDRQADEAGRLMEERLGFRSGGGDPRGLLIDHALERRAGHPLMLACIAHELARRAGMTTAVLSSAGTWLLRFRAHGSTACLSFGEPADPEAQVRRHCSHELAYATLVGLEHGYRRSGRLGCARKAAELRQHLPVWDVRT